MSAASNRGSKLLGPISTELQRDYPLLWEIVERHEMIRQGWDQSGTEPISSEVIDAMQEIWAARNARRNADERASD